MRATRIPLKSEQTADPQLGRIQNYQYATATQVNNVPFIPGIQTGPLTFTAGETKSVVHKLSRTPVGFIVIDAQTNGALVFRGATDENTISLTSSIIGTYNFWIF